MGGDSCQQRARKHYAEGCRRYRDCRPRGPSRLSQSVACNLLRSGMAAKLIFIAAAALAVVPAATSVVWPGRNGEEVSRTVQLRGPFIEFEQTHERIHLRLAPASAAQTGARERIVVRRSEERRVGEE